MEPTGLGDPSENREEQGRRPSPVPQGPVRRSSREIRRAVANYEKAIDSAQGGRPSGSKPPSGVRPCSATNCKSQRRPIKPSKRWFSRPPRTMRFTWREGDTAWQGPRVMLERRLLAGARDDFRKARQLAPGKPEVYLELAKVAEEESGPDAAQRILEDGLKNAPTSIAALPEPWPTTSCVPAKSRRRSNSWKMA